MLMCTANVTNSSELKCDEAEAGIEWRVVFCLVLYWLLSEHFNAFILICCVPHKVPNVCLLWVAM